MMPQQQLVDVLLELTPSCVDYVEVLPPSATRSQAVCRVTKDNPAATLFFIRTPPPLESDANLLVFLHECAHITLGHVDADPYTLRAVHPHYSTYLNEVMAWAKVYRWLEQYGVSIKNRKFYVQSALKNAWQRLVLDQVANE